MIALIPARGHSKRLPGKNIRLFCGEPLIARTIKEALKARLITEVIVSTDSPQIAKLAMRYGARVPFLRPKYLATAKASSIDVFVYTIDRLSREEHRTIGAVCILQPTSPLRTSYDIDRAVKLFKNKKADSVVGFTRVKHPLALHRFVAQNGRLEEIFPDGCGVPGDRETYCANGAVYVVKRGLLEQGRVYSRRSYAYVMPSERSVDIDTAEDFVYAEFLLRREVNKKIL